MDVTLLTTAPLGKTIVEIFFPTKKKRWVKGILIGRTREQDPRFDVMLDDRSIVSCLPKEQVRVVGV